MKKTYTRRFSKERKEFIVLSIIKGELFLEEAMQKYNIQERRTVITWLRKHLREKAKSVS